MQKETNVPGNALLHQSAVGTRGAGRRIDICLAKGGTDIVFNR